MDYDAVLYDPIYAVQGVSATLTIGATVYEELTALDKTSGIDTGEQGPLVQTIRPAACFRVSELLSRGVTVASLTGATLEMNGLQWKVSSHRAKPSPNGEAKGEVFLILFKKRVIEESESE